MRFEVAGRDGQVALTAVWGGTSLTIELDPRAAMDLGIALDRVAHTFADRPAITLDIGGQLYTAWLKCLITPDGSPPGVRS